MITFMIPAGIRSPSLRSRWLCVLLRRTVRPIWGEVPDPRALRARANALDRSLGWPPARCEITPVFADGVPAQWVTARGVTPLRTLLYLHGGGFSFHLPRCYTRFAAEIGRRLEARVLLPDYRLSPEHPFPAAPDDCLVAYRWLLEQGVDPRRLAIAGDSAGANLALVTLLQAKQQGLPQPAAAWLLSPGVDFDWSTTDFETLEPIDPMFTRQAMTLMDPYVGGADRRDPRLSPIHGDLAGLAPLLLEAGEREVLREHVRRFGEAARRAGVTATDRVWPGLPHVFQVMPYLPEARESVREAVAFLRSHIE
jgi:epsilon-lactone hydrolase